MLQNYFFLNRFILELTPLLKNSKIEEIFSQEKSKLIIVTSKDKDFYFLEISVIPGNSNLNLRKNYSRAKKNTLNFFDTAVGQKIDAIQIAEDDRIIKINLSDSNLYFAIRGKFTNLFWIDNNQNIESFKLSDEQNLDQIKSEFTNKKFITGWNSLKIDAPKDENKVDEVRKKYPFLGSEIAKEIKSRIDIQDDDKVVDTYYQILEEIKTSKFCVFIDKNEQNVHIGFENFKSIPFTEKKIFDSSIEAVNFVLSKKHYLVNKYSRQKLITNHLEKELKKISNKINNLQALIDRGSKEGLYNKFGNLLLANLGSFKAGMNNILLDDIYSGEKKINIELNPKLSSKKNVDYYFEKSRNEKISFEKNLQLLERAKKDYAKLKEIYDLLDKIDLTVELDALMKKLKIKQPEVSEAKEDTSSKFKQYLVDNKYRVFVGKDSKNNDLLTTRFAKQNDYWFHARSVSGSHVVLRVENSKEAVPKNVLKKVASLAAFHSKAKTAGVVPVAYTFKKYVVKKKADPVGTVHLLREDVLLVKPEIPDGCEYISSEEVL